MWPANTPALWSLISLVSDVSSRLARNVRQLVSVFEARREGGSILLAQSSNQRVAVLAADLTSRVASVRSCNMEVLRRNIIQAQLMRTLRNDFSDKMQSRILAVPA